MLEKIAFLVEPVLKHGISKEYESSFDDCCVIIQTILFYGTG
jgi:hypothetical protein